MNILFVTKRDQVPRIRILAWYVGRYPHPVIRMDFYNHGHFWALWVQVNWILHDSHLFTYPLTTLMLVVHYSIWKLYIVEGTFSNDDDGFQSGFEKCDTVLKSLILGNGLCVCFFFLSINRLGRKKIVKKS